MIHACAGAQRSLSSFAVAALATGLLAACAQLTGKPAPAPAPLPQPQVERLEPNANLRAEGIPPIPKSLVARVAAYNDFRGWSFADWHPTQRAMLMTHRPKDANLAQLYLLSGPGQEAKRLIETADALSGISFEPRQGRFVLYQRDSGGNETTRVYRLDLDTLQSTPVSAADELSEYVWTSKGDRVVITSVPVDRTATAGRRDTITTTFRLVDPLKPESSKVIAELDGTGWGAGDVSPDDRSLALVRYVSATESSIWRLNLATGAQENLLPGPRSREPRASYSDPVWSRDGKTLFVVTDRFSEFRELAAYDVARKTLRRLTADIHWDVGSPTLSADGRTIALKVNADGVDQIALLDARTGQRVDATGMPEGRLGSIGLSWHRRPATEFAVTTTSPQSPADVLVTDLATRKVERWTRAESDSPVDPSSFATPESIRWRSFDGRDISGLLLMPPARFTGPRPVLMIIHGGPEGQTKAGFFGTWNYLINELGIALVMPNVRGSTGYGKTFLDLDNGIKREDSVKDIGALLDWMATDQRLDIGRVAVRGGSYGGYMSLAVATHYGNRLRGAIDIVGISSFASFLNNTETYRRDLRRSEYGDERDPDIAAFFERISPLANADRIRVPLMVVHGRNDPRVPIGEAEQIVTKVRGTGVPVWFLTADNEGHGFRRKANADFEFFASITFLETYLLPAAAQK
ncbi:S9 family peptidase [soil metagenome]